jgi:hypothetical protein
MKRFLKLLDRRSWDPHQAKQPFAEQAEAAHREFPAMVAGSHLTYWRPGDPIVEDEERYLLGLGATFSPVDLHLADLLDEALYRRAFPGKHIDVFDIADAESWGALRKYFPDLPEEFSGWRTRPILGVWINGNYTGSLKGHAAIDRLLRAFGIQLTADDIAKRMCPAADQWYEDHWPDPGWWKE